jgi:hypothetical protein
MMTGAPPATRSEPPPEPALAAKPAATTPAAPPAATLAPKSAGVVRVGVVKIKDMSGQSLPTDNLRLNLISEFERQHMEAVPLDADMPQQDVENEARAKQCDYFVYTVPLQLKEPGSGGVPPSSLPKGVTLDPAKFQALTGVTLYKVGKPVPELKDLPVAGDASQFAVDAVMATFALQSDAIAQQIADDAHPKPASKAAKTPVKHATTTSKEK